MLHVTIEYVLLGLNIHVFVKHFYPDPYFLHVYKI